MWQRACLVLLTVLAAAADPVAAASSQAAQPPLLAFRLPTFPETCNRVKLAYDLRDVPVTDGRYIIDPPGPLGPGKVPCAMTFEGGGWTVVGRRLPGRIAVSEPWAAAILATTRTQIRVCVTAADRRRLGDGLADADPVAGELAETACRRGGGRVMLYAR